MEITKYREINKGSIKGSFDIKIVEWGGMLIRNSLHFVKEDKEWISFPSQKYEKDGETKYYSYIDFEDVKNKKKFSDKICELIKRYEKKLPEPIPQNNRIVQDDLPF